MTDFGQTDGAASVPGVKDRAILVAAGEDRQLPELARLAETLGLGVAGNLEQGRRDGVGYLGRGKREELRELVEREGAGVVVTDDELSPSQARVLEKSAGATVVDRTLLIIRIFEAHARDAASRLEVELAELSYSLPRVKGGNTALSRLGGGGAGGGGARRGSGEQQLEYDRRVIRERIEKIRKRLRDEKEARKVRGARLKKEGPPKVALVGYTNAGKTTILNALSDEHRSTADRLFETLETTTRLVSGDARRHDEEDGGSASVPDLVLTDTVGFIKKLPTQLVHSFASTLEAAADADVLVLCADASSETMEEEIRTVEETLSETLGNDADGDGAAHRETLLCLNKMDLVSLDRRRELEASYPGAIMISARVDASSLLDAAHEALSRDRVRMRILIPHAEYAAVSGLYGRAEIHARDDTAEGIEMDVTLPKPRVGRYARYRIG